MKVEVKAKVEGRKWKKKQSCHGPNPQGKENPSPARTIYNLHYSILNFQ
jgi:hypothetical protein